MVQPSNSVSANSSGNSNNSSIDISLVFDIALLIFKFWVALIQSIVKTFVPQEIDIKGQTVLITSTGHGTGKELALEYSWYYALSSNS
ncbi:17-beta-hydroxysteroid dehydrogenase 13-like [Bactrocera tryoni]|uniref:17-beta-hydroxysteroid dehydrogenase 13-like n=1 Tax=Bactrocera tryoni TaxID=59916 RepID=UPI001A99C50E|nr:17-beta-hydroxysteroid dehydrogenase 13-like [Bactrocera tryoni]